jgi:NAD(P)H-dependent FMN reductase
VTVGVPHLQIVIGSIREGRRGAPVAEWFAERAADRSDLTSELIDLKAWDLPFLTSPIPPARGDYEEEIRQRWAAKISLGDGYVLVTPE